MDVDAPGYDSNALLRQNAASHGAVEDPFTDCNYSTNGCTSYWAHNRIASSIISPWDRDGDPNDCFYGDPVDISGITVSFDTDATTGAQRFIFSSSFTNNLIDPTTLIDYSFKASWDTTASTEPVYSCVVAWKLDGETMWRSNGSNMIFTMVDSYVASGYNWGIWTDGSVGNNWSGKPWAYANAGIMSTSHSFLEVNAGNAIGYTVKPNTTFRFVIRQQSSTFESGGQNSYRNSGYETRAGKQRIGTSGLILQEYSADGSAGNPQNIWNVGGGNYIFPFGLPYIEFTTP